MLRGEVSATLLREPRDFSAGELDFHQSISHIIPHCILLRYRGYLSVVSEEGSEKATVTVFDVQNKFIAFSAPIKPVMGVVAEWGTILLITQAILLPQKLFHIVLIAGWSCPPATRERHSTKAEHALQEKLL